MCGLREVPGQGCSEPATFENVPVSQPEGRRELSPAGSGERELSRAQVSPAFEIHPHPPRRNPRERGWRGAALGCRLLGGLGKVARNWEVEEEARK